MILGETIILWLITTLSVAIGAVWIACLMRKAHQIHTNKPESGDLRIVTNSETGESRLEKYILHWNSWNTIMDSWDIEQLKRVAAEMLHQRKVANGWNVPPARVVWSSKES